MHKHCERAIIVLKEHVDGDEKGPRRECGKGITSFN